MRTQSFREIPKSFIVIDVIAKKRIRARYRPQRYSAPFAQWDKFSTLE